MGTLHIAPGDSAGGSLRQAIAEAGRGEEVLSHLDDLSCGPIDSNDPSARAAWWAPFHDAMEVERNLEAFWGRVATTDDRLVVWFGRHTAQELAFLLAWADRLGERPYDIVDVTGLQLPFTRRDGSPALTRPAQAASLISSEGLRSLLGRERPVTTQEVEAWRRDWSLLRIQNAPFRVVTATGLASAPANHFDPLLLGRATTAWRRIASLVAETMGYNAEPYIQTGDVMLLARIVALVGDGKLLADGDPWDMRSCRVRLPGAPPALPA